MILIADSGSTKTHWRLIDGEGNIEQAHTPGYNPYYQEPQELVAHIKESPLFEHRLTVNQLYFYGAGCNRSEVTLPLEAELSELFSSSTIHIETDLMAVARGLCGKESGVACILGTGSNSCLFDGSEIVENIPPYGTWLGDEGSGAYLGKQLVIAYLNQELPEELATSFDKRYPDFKQEVLDRVYRQPYPNRYLGQFSKFLFYHLKSPWVYQTLYDAFDLFIRRKVAKYPGVKELPIHFSGSVAFYFNTILRQCLQDQGLHLKNIVENPIAGLTLYHRP